MRCALLLLFVLPGCGLDLAGADFFDDAGQVADPASDAAVIGSDSTSPSSDAGLPSLPTSDAPTTDSWKEAEASTVIVDAAIVDTGWDTTFVPWEGGGCTYLGTEWSCNGAIMSLSSSFCMLSAARGTVARMTPTACNCAETYSCECVVNGLNGVCFDDLNNPIVSCSMNLGGPAVVCSH